MTFNMHTRGLVGRALLIAAVAGGTVVASTAIQAESKPTGTPPSQTQGQTPGKPSGKTPTPTPTPTTTTTTTTPAPAQGSNPKPPATQGQGQTQTSASVTVTLSIGSNGDSLSLAYGTAKSWPSNYCMSDSDLTRALQNAGFRNVDIYRTGPGPMMAWLDAQQGQRQYDLRVNKCSGRVFVLDHKR